MVGGKRVEIGRELTESLLAGKRVINRLTLALLLDSLAGRSRKVEESLSIPFGFVRRFMGWDRINDDGIWGCNFGVSRELFYAINGCDEDFLDGSVEDNDLGIRVINAGGRLKSARGSANVFHLWHKASWGAGNEKHRHNLEILKRRISLKESRCINGIVKLPSAGEGQGR
jgi:GT2 family glycosyltransferase